MGKHLYYICVDHDYNIVEDVNLSLTCFRVAKFVNDAFLSVAHKTLIDVDFDVYKSRPFCLKWKNQIIEMIKML